MRIAHLSAEVAPFAKTGGLGDVAGALPIFEAGAGHDVSVWMPYYRHVREWLHRHGEPPRVVAAPMSIEVGYRSHEVGLLETTLPGSNVPVMLVAHDAYFDRPDIYGAFYGEDDGDARYALFVRAALEAMRRLEKVPDVLHAHDWHASLAPMAVKWEHDWHFAKTATVLTIHNAAYQGVYAPERFVRLGLPTAAFSEAGVMWRGAVNLLKGGVLAADVITAVSPTFAREITTREGGFGLDPVLRHRAGDLVGIVNGIDPKVWNPAVDPRLPERYDSEHLAGKAVDRRHLLVRAGMDPDDSGLVVGLVGRLTSQKGYDLVFPALPALLEEGLRFVFLGSGEPELEALIHFWSQRAPKRFWGYVGFQEDLAHLIEAGADAFLMPSRFEPCGLNQLYSLAYGTPPVVRRVGGLADTVLPFDGSNPDTATGFSFDAPTPSALADTLRWARRAFDDAALWSRLVQNGMAKDYGWPRSAEAYLQLYERALQRRRS